MNRRIVLIMAKWAGLHALMFLAWMFIERLAGFHSTRLEQQPIVGTLIMLPSLAIYVLALLDARRLCYAQGWNWKQGFLAGCLLTAFIVVLSPLNYAITTSLISPAYFANLTEYTVSQGLLTQEQALQQFNVGYYVRTGIVAGLIIGMVFSAVVALFTRSREVRV
jgi:hypothetical protein